MEISQIYATSHWQIRFLRRIVNIVDNFKIRTMNLKYSIRLHQTSPYLDQPFPNNPIKLTTPKRNRALEDEENLKRMLTDFTKACSRCFSEEATLNCHQCRSQFYCDKCDVKVHRKGKFLIHQRDQIKQTSLEGKVSKKPAQNISRLQDKLFEDEYKKSVILMINQTWDSFSSDISQKFRSVIDSLKDKKKQIAEKMQKRREQQIKQFELSCNSHESETSIGRSSLCYLNYGIQNHSKVQSLGNEEFDQKIEKKYKLSLNLLQQINSLTQKIELKNILTRTVEELPLPTSKKPMKRSMVFLSPSGSSALSPGVRTPNHTKSQLSQSTIEASPMEFAMKMTQQAKKKVIELQKQSKMLMKVRSQKLFCKSPTGNTQKFVNKEKTTIKKSEKQGQ